eukprot:COSAG01_NODE_31997_length_587_cov_1699.434426_1_plen_195_part_11
MALTVTLGEGHDACMAWYYTGRTMEEPQLALLYRSCATITHHIDMSLAGYYAGGGAEPARLYEGYCFTAVAYVRHLVERRCLAAAERERVEQERQNLERAEAVLTRELGMWQFYGRGEIEPPLRLCYSSGEKDSSRSSVDLGSSMSRLGSSTARPTPSTSRLGSLSTISSSADQLKQYMKQRGLEAWHGHLSKHL